jgi:dethiobiotin synthetase
LLVEGVGGLLCPLTARETIADLAAALKYPLLVVARLGLGTVNHTLLTVEAARSRGLTVAGIVLNEAEPLASLEGTEENPVEIERRTRIPVLGILRHGRSLPTRADGSAVSIDWAALARCP